MKHIIKKQQLLVTIPPGMDPFQLQHTADRFYRDILLPALDQIFNELSREDEVIRLDHLYIDLGRVGEALLQTRVLDQYLYDLIKEQVRDTIEVELAKRPFARQSLRENILDQWWFYMQHGRLPWNADPITADWYRKVVEMFSVDFPAITHLRTVIAHQPAVLMRISAQHNDWFLQQLVVVLVSTAQEELIDAIEQSCLIGYVLEQKYRAMPSDSTRADISPADDRQKSHAPGRDIQPTEVPHEIFRQWAVRHAAFLRLPLAERKRYLWRRVLAEAAAHPSDFADAGGLEILLDRIWDHPSLMHLVLSDDRLIDNSSRFVSLLRRRYEVVTGNPAPSGYGESPATQWSQPDLSRLSSPPSELNRAVKTSDTKSDAAQPPTRPGPDAADDIESLLKAAGPEADLLPDGEDTIYLPHAGIILLHPHLSTLFNRLGYWDGSEFRDLEARHRAIALLHFLATGEQRGQPEYQLVLPKILCAYPLDLPVPAEIALTDDECAEGDLLLQSAIARWDKMAGTSIDGLRESFLRRDGQLTHKDGRLDLKVQPTGIDVLLDYLPWNLSVVKLPWLKNMLYVEWR